MSLASDATMQNAPKEIREKCINAANMMMNLKKISINFLL
jgi:hypothetical protein